MKNLISVFLLASFCLAAAAQTPSEPPLPPVIRLHFKPGYVGTATTMRVLPGQIVHIGNDFYSYVRIGSDFPLLVHTGNCQATGTTDIICNIQPSQAVIFQDTRIGVPVDKAKVNRVRLTALRDAP